MLGAGNAVWGTVVTTAACILINLFSLTLLLKLVLGRSVFPESESSSPILGAVAVVTLLNYLYLSFGGRFASIAKEFESEPRPSATKHKWLTGSYFVLSFVVLVMLLGAVERTH